MNCSRCKQDIAPGDEHEHLGETLCEDCCMIALSPIKTCDPWAVHSAKNFEKRAGKNRSLTPTQSRMLKILEEKGAMEPAQLAVELGPDLQVKDLERDFAALRHMEKVRGEKRGDRVLWRLW